MLSRNSVTAIMVAGLLMVGCGSSNSSSEQSPTLNEENIVSSVSQTQEMSETSFVDGVVVEDTVLEVVSTDSELNATTTIPQGTQFVDGSGTVLQSAPKLAVSQSQSSSSTEDAENTTTTNVVEGKFKFEDSSGNKVVPTEPVTLSMKAPAGALPGDEVRVETPDGVEKATGQEKLTIYIVDKNGRINMIIFPQVFETLDVVVVIVEKVIVAINVAPITGGEGGN